VTDKFLKFLDLFLEHYPLIAYLVTALVGFLLHRARLANSPFLLFVAELMKALGPDLRRAAEVAKAGPKKLVAAEAAEKTETTP
jgi:hypothetical protein